MKFDFLKETPKELNTNVWNTFGILGKKFFVSYENEIVLVYDDVMNRDEGNMISLYQRYDFLKAIHDGLTADPAEANVSLGTIDDIVEARAEKAGTFDGSRLIDPKFTIGTGLCGYAFVEKNGKLYSEYKKLADKEENVIFGGRLGEYKYYDMDQAIAAALKKVEELK